MSVFVKNLATRLINSALLLCLSLGLLVTACSNAGVALNSNPVVLEPVSIHEAEADQALVDSGSLDDAVLVLVYEAEFAIACAGDSAVLI